MGPSARGQKESCCRSGGQNCRDEGLVMNKSLPTDATTSTHVDRIDGRITPVVSNTHILPPLAVHLDRYLQL